MKETITTFQFNFGDVGLRNFCAGETLGGGGAGPRPSTAPGLEPGSRAAHVRLQLTAWTWVCAAWPCPRPPLLARLWGRLVSCCKSQLLVPPAPRGAVCCAVPWALRVLLGTPDPTKPHGVWGGSGCSLPRGVRLRTAHLPADLPAREGAARHPQPMCSH